MPLGVTLLELRRELRAETGTSMNPAQGTQAQGSLDIILARQQRELWDAYNWQHLRYWKDIPLAKNQTAYSYPPELKFDQISEMLITTVVRDGSSAITGSGNWRPLIYGVQPHMIRLGTPGTGTPVRWRNVATVTIVDGVPITNPIGQFELLPTPDTDDYMLRLNGQTPLSPLIADTDTCILDSQAIVLFAAAEILAMQKSEVASMKLTKAQNYLRRILADQGADKRANYNMGGNHRGGNDPDRSRRGVAYVDYVP